MHHPIIVDLGFGDAGKGTLVDYICATEDIRAVVRFSGGPQAAHNVVLPDGTHHTFAQFGSGTFHGVPTFISRFMMVNPLNMAKEAEHIQALTGIDPWQRVFIDGSCLLVTPYHVAANRARELARGERRHGSTGQGVGETASYGIDFPDEAPRMRDLSDRKLLKHKLRVLRRRLTQEVGRLDTCTAEDLLDSYKRLYEERRPIICESSMLNHFLDAGKCVFEGSQGVLLDEWYGFHPYTTWSTTTAENAQRLIREGGHDGRKIGVMRSYMTRHGAGPFPTEVDPRSFTSLSNKWNDEKHNGTGRFQGAWRVGNLDLTLIDYAARVCGGLDEVAITHMDRVGGRVGVSYGGNDLLGVKKTKTDLGYQARLTDFLSQPDKVDVELQLVRNGNELVEMAQKRLEAPVTVTSYGPTWTDKRALVSV